MTWTVELLDHRVEDEVRALPADMRARLSHLSVLIEEFGPVALRFPDARHLEGDLWELRIRGRDGIARAIYVAVHRRRVVIVHAFVKKSQKTPSRALNVARERAKEVKHG